MNSDYRAGELACGSGMPVLPFYAGNCVFETGGAGESTVSPAISIGLRRNWLSRVDQEPAIQPYQCRPSTSVQADPPGVGSNS